MSKDKRKNDSNRKGGTANQEHGFMRQGRLEITPLKNISHLKIFVKSYTKSNVTRLCSLMMVAQHELMFKKLFRIP